VHPVIGVVFQQSLPVGLSPKGQPNTPSAGVSEYHSQKQGLMMSDPCIQVDKGQVMKLTINGTPRSCDYPDNAFAVYALRNDLDLKGVRMGCGDGHCGACTILVDGVPTTSCDLPFGALEGKHVVTPEGVGTVTHPHPIQAAVLAEQPGQCGFCLSGILMRSVALVDSGKHLTETDVRAALDKHLCRCGSQPRIIKAVMAALEKVQTV